MPEPLPFVGMADLYEQWASETLTMANEQPVEDRPAWSDGLEEVASELLSLANAARRAEA